MCFQHQFGASESTEEVGKCETRMYLSSPFLLKKDQKHVHVDCALGMVCLTQTSLFAVAFWCWLPDFWMLTSFAWARCPPCHSVCLWLARLTWLLLILLLASVLFKTKIACWPACLLSFAPASLCMSWHSLGWAAEAKWARKTEEGLAVTPNRLNSSQNAWLPVSHHRPCTVRPVTDFHGCRGIWSVPTTQRVLTTFRSCSWERVGLSHSSYMSFSRSSSNSFFMAVSTPCLPHCSWLSW